MKSTAPIAPALIEAAASWFVRLREAELSTETHAAWLAWIEASPRHRDAFSAVQATWHASGTVQWPALDELAEPPPSSRPVSSSRAFRSPAGSVAALIVVGAIATLAGLGSVSGGWTHGFAGSKEVRKRIATGRAEPQSAVLPDGSRLELGALTGVEVRFTPQRRLVVADEGETFYQVHHDPNRPFIVEAGPVRVTAIGTAFSVRREGEAVSVSVQEGVVDIKPNLDDRGVRASSRMPERVSVVRAKAGQQIRFDGLHFASVSAPAEGANAAWHRGRLRFVEEPLAVVVANLNRYSGRRIVIGDSALDALRFTGTVSSVEDWLKAVQIVFAVEVRDDDPDRVVIEPAASSSAARTSTSSGAAH